MVHGLLDFLLEEEQVAEHYEALVEEKKQSLTLIDACPSCDSSQTRSRKTKSPTWICDRCGETFEEPNRRSKAWARDPGDLARRELARELSEKQTGEIRPDYDRLIVEQVTRYLAGEDVVVLCRDCHGAHHDGRVLCPRCEENYRKRSFETCVECALEEGRLERCEEHDEVYSSDRGCKECALARFEERQPEWRRRQRRQL